jgi:hypothetical protein
MTGQALRTWARRSLWAWGLLLVLATPALAAEKVGLKVAVIHATKTGDSVDPALAKIQGDLQRTFGGYKSFKQLSKSELDLAQGAPQSVKLPNGEDAKLTYKGERANRHDLRLDIPASKVGVDLSAPLRKMFYQAGMKYDGGILILALYLTPP